MGTQVQVNAGDETGDLPDPRGGHDAARAILSWCRTMATDPAPGSTRFVEGWNASLQALATRIAREYDL